MIGIKIYNTFNQTFLLELLPNTTIQMEKILPAFDNDLQGDDFSLPLEIPFTDHNKKVLLFSENLKTPNHQVPEYWRCDILVNNLPIINDAKLKLLNTKGRFDYKVGTYSFTITGTKGLYGTFIKNKKLTDLHLGGMITWQNKDSREFAKDFCDGLYSQYEDRLTFSPLYFGDCFDMNRLDYMNEYIKDQHVNAVIEKVGYSNGWIFGRADDSNPNNAVSKGTVEYKDYRTIPFLNLFYVLKKVFTEHGFTVDGTFFSYPNFEKITLFNNFCIEKYDTTSNLDTNTEINPKNHVPNILISDFLIAIQNFFNLKIDFLPGMQVRISFKKEMLLLKNTKRMDAKCIPTFENAERHESYYGGATIVQHFDSNDSYHSDKIKEVKNLNVIADVFLFTDISGLTFSFTLDDTHYIYVIAENYYYNYNASNNTWEAFSEYLNNFEEGKNTTSFETACTPLCQHYILDTTSNQIKNENMVAVRMLGSYFSYSKERVVNDFGIRLFYADTITGATLTNRPISYTHNYDVNGIKRANTSLAFLAQDGIYNKFWEQWILFLKNAMLLNTSLMLNENDITEIATLDAIEIEHNFYLIKKISADFPLLKPSNVELVKV